MTCKGMMQSCIASKPMERVAMDIMGAFSTFEMGGTGIPGICLGIDGPFYQVGGTYEPNCTIHPEACG